MKFDEIRYPVYRQEQFWDLIAPKVRYMPFKCIICNKLHLYKVKGKNLREDCTCLSCRSFNRQRQISNVLISAVLGKNSFLSSLESFIPRNDLHIYNTESKGAIHGVLSKMKNYVCSEYFGEQYTSGSYVDGILHQDLQNLSFADNSFDVVISAEVFEHIPDTYKAFKEVHRVLKPGGRHIFTIPFDARSFTDLIKATIDEKGNIQYLTEPE